LSSPKKGNSKIPQLLIIWFKGSILGERNPFWKKGSLSPITPLSPKSLGKGEFEGK